MKGCTAIFNFRGYLCEKAISVATGRRWNDHIGPDWKMHTRDGDVPPYEVRGITKPHHRLFVFAGDPDDRPFVLVERAWGPSGRTWRIRGWIMGRDAKRKEWWHENERHEYTPITSGGHRPEKGVFYVPNDALFSPDQGLLGDDLRRIGRLPSPK